MKATIRKHVWALRLKGHLAHILSQVLRFCPVSNKVHLFQSVYSVFCEYITVTQPHHKEIQPRNVQSLVSRGKSAQADSDSHFSYR